MDGEPPGEVTHLLLHLHFQSKVCYNQDFFLWFSKKSLMLRMHLIKKKHLYSELELQIKILIIILTYLS